MRRELEGAASNLTQGEVLAARVYKPMRPGLSVWSALAAQENMLLKRSLMLFQLGLSSLLSSYAVIISLISTSFSCISLSSSAA